MSKDRPRNLAASVRRRLTNLSRERGEDFQLVLTNYVIERLLYRISRSEYAERFVLKGAMLFRLWADQPHRPTRDLDLLGRGESSVEAMLSAFRSLCGVAVEDDGLTFDPDTVTAGKIKEDQEYEGVRVECRVHLGQARIALQIDVGFGDAVVPRPVEVTYPAMLEFPAPVIKAYSRQTVVAEKFQAMVALGIANTRMKDFFDLWVLTRTYRFEGDELSKAIQATFARRRTPLPTTPPIALTPEFGSDSAKSKQWQAFVRKGRLDVESVTLAEVCEFLHSFLMPPVSALAASEPFGRVWLPAGPWSDND